MHILLASSEAVPFAKTGGLADVATSLSLALSKLGHHVTLVVPHYPQRMPEMVKNDFQIRPNGDDFKIKVGTRTMEGRFLIGYYPDSNLKVMLVDQPDYYDRPALYLQDNIDYEDNCERFVFFSRAVVEAAHHTEATPDIIHANDWQTGLVPIVVSEELRKNPDFKKTASVFTIHNMKFQGRFWHWDMPLTGFDWKYFNWKQMESYGEVNLLKTGIVFADMVTTVSPTYAKEIQSPEFGNGLDTALAGRKGSLVGILNGVNTDDWNPRIDPFIAENYTQDNVFEHKPACKANLQSTVGLPQKPDAALIGMVSRITDQKGFDLIVNVADQILTGDVQLVFLGTGDPFFEGKIREIASRYPDKVAVEIGFSEELAHKIEAGSDMFLMPSLFEPCGLNQMYSMVYGTVPLVHVVGGLADSVANTTTETLADGTANGFSFDEYSVAALQDCINRALETFKDKETWSKVVLNGMTKDWSWNQSAQKYVAVYEQALNNAERKTAV